MAIRLARVKKELISSNLDTILVSSVPNIIYLTGFSSFSKDEREAFLFITKEEAYIVTDGRYSEAVSIQVPDFKLIERSQENPIKKILEDIVKKHKIKRLGIEENNITVLEHKMLKKHFKSMSHYSIDSLRSVKDQNEIDTIKKACELGDKAFNFILNKIKEGVSEKEIAFLLEEFIKKQGGELSFPTIVAFGKNSSVPHHERSNQRLVTSGQFVLLDFGVKLNNYCSDMTRTVFFGKASAEQKKMYQTVLAAQQKAIEHLKRLTSDGGRLKRSGSHDSSEVDSTKAKDVDKGARDYIMSQGYPSIPHSLGHGVGLEVHESPTLSLNSKDELREGMVFSVEPGIYVRGFGGVRIEDLVVLEKKGPRLLTKSPKELTII